MFSPARSTPIIITKEERRVFATSFGYNDHVIVCDQSVKMKYGPDWLGPQKVT